MRPFSPAGRRRPAAPQIEQLLQNHFLWIQAALLWQIADLDLVGIQWFAVEQDASAIRGEDLHDDADHGRLACTVSPEQAERSPAFHTQMDALEHLFCTEALCDVFGCQPHRTTPFIGLPPPLLCILAECIFNAFSIRNLLVTVKRFDENTGSKLPFIIDKGNHQNNNKEEHYG